MRFVSAQLSIKKKKKRSFDGPFKKDTSADDLHLRKPETERGQNGHNETVVVSFLCLGFLEELRDTETYTPRRSERSCQSPPPSETDVVALQMRRVLTQCGGQRIPRGALPPALISAAAKQSTDREPSVTKQPTRLAEAPCQREGPPSAVPARLCIRGARALPMRAMERRQRD